MNSWIRRHAALLALLAVEAAAVAVLFALVVPTSFVTAPVVLGVLVLLLGGTLLVAAGRG